MSLRGERGLRRGRRRCFARGRLAGEDFAQAVDIDLCELTLALVLEPGDELGMEDVDLAVEQPALVGDLVLLRFEVGDHLLQVGIRQRREVRESVHEGLSSRVTAAY